MSFFQKFMNFKSSNKIAISMDEYEKALEERLKNIVWREEYLDSTEAEKAAIEQALLDQHYPKTNNFMIALASANPQKIQAAYKVYQEWNKGPLPEALFQFKAYCLYGSKGKFNEQETLRYLLQKTSTNLHKLGKIIEEVTGKITGWKSVVTIKPKEPQEREWLSPMDKAIIEVSRPPASAKFGCALLPNNVEVWMLDENNDGFYQDEELQKDFFELIKEVQQTKVASPRIMTLYFEAPAKERVVYTDARRKLSVFGSVEIYPRSMKESAGEPSIYDTWKVKMDSRYLIEVQPGQFEPLDNIQVPIKYIELIREGIG